MTTAKKLAGPEKWLELSEKRKTEQKEEKRTAALLQSRKYGLTDSTTRSQYFIEKYPLIEKTREERRIAREKQ